MFKKFCVGVCCVMAAFSFVACGSKKVPYNAVMYGNVYEVKSWLNDDFYEENLTYGSWSSIKKDYVKDESVPQYRTLIITGQNQLDEIFKEFPTEIYFDKDMVLMHCFTTASSSEYEIANITLNDQTLCIRYKHPVSKGRTPPNASMPLTKWVVVKMDKLDIATAEFIFGK